MSLSFQDLYQEYFNKSKVSRNVIAREAGLDPSYLSRLRLGSRGLPKSSDIVSALARALRLSPVESSRLHLAAGFPPPTVSFLGWDETLQDVVDVLNDPDLPQEAKDEFLKVLRLLSVRYKLKN